MLFIGVDPGKAGGIAILHHSGAIVAARSMPATEQDIIEALKQTLELPTHAVLEHVWSTPGQGGAFAFGRSVGHLQMALTAVGIPFDQVLPKRWQSALGIHYPKGAGDTVKKNITKRRAQQLFPRHTITHAIADALLMAEYCRRLHSGAIDGKEKGRSAQGHTEARGTKQGENGKAAGASRSRTAAAAAHP